jgi:hypothetical protein
MNCFIRIGGDNTVQALCNQGVGSVTTVSDRALSVVATG